jgi:hypothetical protein
VEADAVHGAHLSGDAAQEAAADREMLAQVDDLENVHGRPP